MLSLFQGFTSEAELLSHLKSSYEKALAERDSTVLTGVQQLLSAVKTFFAAESNLEVRHVVQSMYHFYRIKIM